MTSRIWGEQQAEKANYCKVAQRFLIGFIALAVAACSSSPSESGPVVTGPTQTPDRQASETPDLREFERRRYDRNRHVEPLHMQGDEPVRVGLLLPFSGATKGAQRTAAAMFDAASVGRV